MMVDDEDGGKRAVATSGSILRQKDTSEHQQEGEPPKSREDSHVPHQATTSHDTDRASEGRAKRGSQTQEGEPEQHRRRIADWNAIVALATVGLLVLGVGTLGITIFQLNAMKDQLDQMKDANKKTDAAIETASRQAKAAEDANTIARSALASSDRPWLSAKISSTDSSTDGGVPFKIIIGNDGKAPAREVKYTFEIKVVPTTRQLMTKITPAILGEARSKGPITIFSSDKFEDIIQTTEDKINSATSGPYSSNLINIVGRILYHDSYSINHETSTCVGYDKVLRKIGSCTMEFDAVAN